MMSNVVHDVVHKNRCTGCGVCVGLCPAGALSMRLHENGDLIAHINSEGCFDKCHLCLDICPFSKGFHNPRQRNIEIFNNTSDAHYNEDIGWHLHSFVGFRSDDKLRGACASGGLLTWCLEQLLQEGLVTRIAVVRLASNRKNGFFEFYSASSIDDIRECSGSFYHPVEISEVIKEIFASKQEHWAIVGVPCLCAAIRNCHNLQKSVRYLFGLACGMYQNTFYTELLLSKSGLIKDNIAKIEYRRKSDSGLSSNYRFRGTDNRGAGKEIPYQGLPYYLGKNAYFRQNACNFCMDVFAETADACFMDAWLPEYFNEPKGTSIVVIRNKELSLLFQQGAIKEDLCVKELEPAQVIQSQSGHIRSKRELISMRRGISKPCQGSKAPTANERINWWMQRLSQVRSKKSWAHYGRRFGPYVFWFTMLDILLMQFIIDQLFRIIPLLKTFTSKYRIN